MCLQKKEHLKRKYATVIIDKDTLGYYTKNVRK